MRRKICLVFNLRVGYGDLSLLKWQRTVYSTKDGLDVYSMVYYKLNMGSDTRTNRSHRSNGYKQTPIKTGVCAPSISYSFMSSMRDTSGISTISIKDRFSFSAAVRAFMDLCLMMPLTALKNRFTRVAISMFNEDEVIDY